MRALAFLLFALAAVDVGIPYLDRSGVALLGFAFLVLAVAPRRGRFLPRPRLTVPPKTVELNDAAELAETQLRDRIGLYDLTGDGAR